MSVQLSGKKVFVPRPPDKGSFPLDHDGECKHLMVAYLTCLQKTDCDSSSCRELSKEYLSCRMDKQLMAKEDMTRLGFNDQVKEESRTTQSTQSTKSTPTTTTTTTTPP